MADVLGTFEQAVLLEVLRLRDEAYGRVHATLERLESKGLLSSRLGPGTDIRAGRARRFYRVQPAGIRALNDARQTFKDIWRGIKWPITARESL
jgi:DNA-binding PadR family transcriptional regulator